MSDDAAPETTDATDNPSVTFEWTPGGLAFAMHKMSGPMLLAIAGVAHHEAEKLLFQADFVAAEKNGSRIVVPGGRH